MENCPFRGGGARQLHRSASKAGQPEAPGYENQQDGCRKADAEDFRPKPAFRFGALPPSGGLHFPQFPTLLRQISRRHPGIGLRGPSRAFKTAAAFFTRNSRSRALFLLKFFADLRLKTLRKVPYLARLGRDFLEAENVAEVSDYKRMALGLQEALRIILAGDDLGLLDHLSRVGRHGGYGGEAWLDGARRMGASRRYRRARPQPSRSDRPRLARRPPRAPASKASFSSVRSYLFSR